MTSDAVVSEGERTGSLVAAGPVGLWVARRGAGAPLLLIAGMGATHASWGPPFLDALRAAGLAPIAYDHRGMGRSRRWREPFTVAELARDAVELLDALGLRSVHVLGASMGGMVAQELALAAPERVDSLVLACTSAGGRAAVAPDPDDLAALADATASGDGTRVLQASFALNVSRAHARRAGSFEAFRALAVAAPTPGAVTLLQLAAAGAHDAADRVGALRPPTLVIHGDEDRMVPVANAVALATAIPGARLELLEGVGHALWWERPSAVAALVADHALSPDPSRPSRPRKTPCSST